MPIDFPSLPSSGQVYSYNSRSWMYNGTGWQSIAYLTSGSVVSGSLAFGTVFSGNIASGQIGWPHIASGAINSGKIGDDAIVTNSIASGQVTGSKIAASTVANANLVNSTITIAGSSTSLGGSWAAQALSTSSGLLAGTYYPSGSLTIGIANAGIVSGLIASGQVGAFHLASGTLQSAPATLQSGQITSGYLGNASVVSGSIASGQIGAVHLASGTLQSAPATLQSGQITSGYLGNASVVSGSIASGQVSRYHIANTSIFSGHISSSEVGSVHLASGAVTSGKIADTSVTSGNIASGQVGTFHHAAASILSGQIGANVIGSPHILAGSIANASLTNSSITIAGSSTSLGGSWAAAALTAASGLLAGTYYPSGSLTIGIASGGITSQMIADGAVVSGDVGSASLGGVHISSGSLTGNNLAASTVANANLVASTITIAGSSTALGGTWAAAALTTASGLLAGTYYPSGSITIGIASGGISSQLIADNAVASGEIASGQVGQYHHASGSVTSGHIGQFAVANINIISGTVANDKLANSTITIAGSSTALGGSWAAAALTTSSGLLAGTYYPSGSLTIGIANAGIISGLIGSGQIGTFHLASGTLQSAPATLQSGQITSGYLGNASVVSGSIASGQVGAYHFNAANTASGKFLSVDGTGIISWQSPAAQAPASGTVTQFSLASGAVNSGHIGNNAVVSGSIASGQVGTFHHQASSILSGQIGANVIGSPHILAGSVTNTSLQNSAITIAGSSTSLGGSWAAAALTTSSGLLAGTYYPSGSLTIGIASGGVTNQMLADGAVTSGDIASGQVSRFHIANTSIFSGHISSSEIGSVHLASGAVTSGKIADNAVTSGNIASGQVGTFHHAAASILSGQIGANVIGSPHILAGSITNTSLQNSAITIAGSSTSLGGSWAAAALTASSGLLAGTYYPSGSLTIGIASGGITTQMLADGSVTSGDIASGQIGANHLASGAVGAAAVAGSSGQIQFNAGGSMGASAALTFASGGPNLGITTQGTGNIPLRITTASGHTTNSLEIYHSGALSAWISPDGILGITQNYGGTQKSNTIINGGLGAPSAQYRSVVIGTSASITAAASTGEAVAIGYGAIVYANYGIAIGQGTGAGNTSIAIGLSAVANGADRSIAIGYLTNAPYSFSCAFGSRANTTANGQFLWATETADPSILLQRFSSANVLRGTYNVTTTWISNIDGSTTSRVVLGPMYASSQQEAIRMDAASDLARVGMGGPASGRLCVYTGAAANKGLMIQGFTSQSANLTEWQDSAGTPSCVMTSSGNLIMGNQTAQGFTLEVARANNFSFTGTAYRVACFNATTAAASDRPGIQLGYDTAGAGIVAAATNSTGSDLAFWTYNGSAWAEKSRLTKNGYFGINSSTPSGQFQISNSTAALIPAIIRGAASQTANLTEWQTSSFATVARINASGEFFGLLSSGIVTSGAIASGQVGNNHLTTTISNKVIEGDIQTINPQSGTTYTLLLSDAGKLVTLNNGSAIALTVPLNSTAAFSIGTHVDLAQLGAGQVTVAGAVGVTVNYTPGNKLRAQYAGASLIKVNTDSWLLFGDLSA